MIFAKVVSVFFLVLLGFFCNRIGWLPIETSKYISKIVVNVAAPCVILGSFSQQNIGGEDTRIVLLLFGVGIIQYFFAFLISIPTATLLSKEKEDRGIYRNFFVMTNNAFMGFPITIAIFGQQGLFYMVIMNGLLTISLFSLGIYNTKLYRGGKSEKKDGALAVIKRTINPPNVAVVVGLVVMFLQINLGEVIQGTLATIGGMMSPLAMMIVGVQLSQSKPRELFLNKRLIIMSALRLVVIPVIFLMFMLPFYFNGIFTGLFVGVLTLNLLLPPATLIVVFAEEYNSNTKLSAEGVFLATLLSMITLPIASVVLNLTIV